MQKPIPGSMKLLAFNSLGFCKWHNLVPINVLTSGYAPTFQPRWKFSILHKRRTVAYLRCRIDRVCVAFITILEYSITVHKIYFCMAIRFCRMAREVSGKKQTTISLLL